MSTTTLRPRHGNFTVGFTVLVRATVLFGFGLSFLPRVVEQRSTPCKSQRSPCYAAMIFGRNAACDRVYLAGAPLMIALGGASMYLYVAHPAWWVATARRMMAA